MPEVELVPLPRERFESFISGTIQRYAEEVAEAEYALGEAAMKKSREDTLRLLPEGIDTPGHYFYLIREAITSEDIGEVWFRLEEVPRKAVFIFSIFLKEEFRGKGYGKATMGKIDEAARGLGAEAVALHVFGKNERAIRLYTSCGYRIRSLNMGKDLR